jgi:hypothetical protein
MNSDHHLCYCYYHHFLPHNLHMSWSLVLERSVFRPFLKFPSQISAQMSSHHGTAILSLICLSLGTFLVLLKKLD